MNAVFDPSILFISDSDWVIEEERDLFLEKLHNIIKNLDDVPNVQIYWDDIFEACLWEYPQLPPWRRDRDFCLQLVPMIYKLFQKNVQYIEFKNDWNCCAVNPVMQYYYPNILIFEHFLKLMHEIIDRSEEIFLCTSQYNASDSYVFSCTCHDYIIDPTIIKSGREFLDYIGIEDIYWPENKNDAAKFKIAIELTRERLFYGKPLYKDYFFTNSFIKDLLRVKKHRANILRQIAKRVSMSLHEAESDPSLQDEYIESTKVRRIRVTQRPSSLRIQYDYKEDESIVFLSFSDEGHHDDAL